MTTIKFRAVCAAGTFTLLNDRNKNQWTCGDFPPVGTKMIEKLMGNKAKNQELLEKLLCALAYRATKKMNQRPDKLVSYVWADVKKGKAPGKKTGEWTVTEIEIEVEHGIVSEADALLACQLDAVNEGPDWAAEEAQRAHRRRCEREGEGFVELDMNGNEIGRLDADGNSRW